MTFISLDDKKECVAFFEDNALHPNTGSPKSLRTWKYTPAFHKQNIEYAHIISGGKDFDEVCPDSLKDEWEALSRRAKAFVRSFIESKVSLRENCFYDLVPDNFLLDYCRIKCKIIDHVLDTYPKSENYNFNVELEIVLNSIRNNKLNIFQDNLKLNSELYQKFANKENYIIYNQFGSKTGRLTTEEDSFPILTLKKDYRNIINPNNDFFIELDYNAAEIRVFLALNGFKQPSIDIHDWNKQKFGYPDRNSAKNNFISWLYGKKNIKETEFKKIYNVDKIKEKFWDGEKITNYYGRKIQSDNFHAVNYIVQSTTADLVLRQILKVNELLKNTKSQIAMIIHDNVIIDMKKDDKKLIKDIISIYNSTEFGNFKSSIKLGTNLGNMKSIL